MTKFDNQLFRWRMVLYHTKSIQIKNPPKIDLGYLVVNYIPQVSTPLKMEATTNRCYFFQEQPEMFDQALIFTWSHVCVAIFCIAV